MCVCVRVCVRGYVCVCVRIHLSLGLCYMCVYACKFEKLSAILPEKTIQPSACKCAPPHWILPGHTHTHTHTHTSHTTTHNKTHTHTHTHTHCTHTHTHRHTQPIRLYHLLKRLLDQHPILLY